MHVAPTFIYCHGALAEVKASLPSSWKRVDYGNVYTCTGCGRRVPWLIRAPILIEEEE